VIVRPADDGCLLITQPDHAALAGRIMAHWSSLANAERRDLILRATSDHDDGWRDPDAAPTIDAASGAIRDFMTVPARVKQEVWPRALAGLAGAPWAAALVAHHAASVYDRFRGDPDWDGFFSAMEAARSQNLAAAGLAMDALVRDYVYVRLGDLASLVFCNGWSEPQVLGPWTIRLLDRRHLLVEPNPFAHDVPLAVEARQLPGSPWPSDDALQAAFHAAPIVSVTGLVVGRTRTS
jgi:hypothetical protein